MSAPANPENGLQVRDTKIPFHLERDDPKILVIQQKMIGDVLISSIICEALRKKFSNAIMHYVVNTNAIPVILHHPHIDRIIEFKKDYKKDKRLFYSFLKDISNSNYDIVIDTYGKLESNLMTFFSGADIKVSFYKWYTQFFYTTIIRNQLVKKTDAGIAIENRLRLVCPEASIRSENMIRPKIYLTDKEKINAEVFLKEHQIDPNSFLIMIGILGSEPKKTLPAKQMAKIVDTIVQQTDATILFNYIPSQKKEAFEIYELTHTSTQRKIRFEAFAGGLREFLAVLSHCDAMVGNEGGATNMAKALNVPTFTIFSPWILKEAWNMFEDGTTHISVHLKDYKPELYGNTEPKEMKKEALELYREFDTTLIFPELERFLKNIQKSNS